MSPSFSSLFAFAALATTSLASSVTLQNSCSYPVWVRDSSPGANGRIVRVNANSPSTDVTQGGAGFVLNLLTGCSDDSGNGCATGDVGGGALPFGRVEATFTDTYVNYDLSLEYGWNVPVEIGAPSCPYFACTSLPGCPVPGPDGSCYSPCCASADNCQGTNSCPYETRDNGPGGKGVNSQYYMDTCPNAYAWPIEDSDVPSAYIDTNCGNQDLQINFCPPVGNSNIPRS
ncbi:Osmotin, thaumatin-like protein [Jaminaea rosea]|uniref:Osmotin, thaumatin-like protein n=1 Tax=Jaminaea rosea TaxID=1569628 RepID=A0A316UKJ4_9BASI|nr:Osmotin, thaumatin-like protein [Jaminaea rosea]PWN25454.1 Osmotin, thaumatin-like protein [Jaminaea rosea]